MTDKGKCSPTQAHEKGPNRYDAALKHDKKAGKSERNQGVHKD